MSYFRSATDSPELPGAEAVHSALTASVDSGNYEQAARHLIDLSALRPFDAFASDIRPIIPSTHEGFDTQIGQGRIAILAMCLRHIEQFGDGELSMFLGDSLQHLPNCEAHLDRLIKFDAAIFDGNIPEGSRCGLLGDSFSGLNLNGVDGVHVSSSVCQS